jgi:hypothetical protein
MDVQKRTEEASARRAGVGECFGMTPEGCAGDRSEGLSRMVGACRGFG